MSSGSDVAVLVRAARGLDIRPRARRWTHLPVCVLDAVFSINSRYAGVIAVCDRYAEQLTAIRAIGLPAGVFADIAPKVVAGGTGPRWNPQASCAGTSQQITLPESGDQQSACSRSSSRKPG